MKLLDFKNKMLSDNYGKFYIFNHKLYFREYKTSYKHSLWYEYYVNSFFVYVFINTL